jgi:hypothetical protein
MPNGKSRLRMLKSKTEKRLVEELIPIARYIQYRYHEAYRVKVRWNGGSQRHDAVLLGSGVWVNHGLAAKRLAVETTMSMHPNEYLVRENVDKGGASFGPETTKRDKKTGKIAFRALSARRMEHGARLGRADHRANTRKICQGLWL